ncbi:MAG: hypothetical protein Q8O30_12310, partial [Candidatus Omnitrophota bacterium]|nr:hypothetical protein [Candidatus Omnitrophota bacterium]
VHGVDSFDEEYKNSLKVKVAGVVLRLLPLEKIIKSKQYLRRGKDVLVLPVLKDTLISKKKLFRKK